MNQMYLVKFWEINSGWHTGGDKTQYTLIHGLPPITINNEL